MTLKVKFSYSRLKFGLFKCQSLLGMIYMSIIDEFRCVKLTSLVFIGVLNLMSTSPKEEMFYMYALTTCTGMSNTSSTSSFYSGSTSRTYKVKVTLYSLLAPYLSVRVITISSGIDITSIISCVSLKSTNRVFLSASN